MSFRKLAAFSIMQNEDIFSRIWVNYYSTVVSKSDIYILNHNTTTPLALKHLEDFKKEGVNVIDVHNMTSFNHQWLKDTVQDFQSFLLRSYEAVLFSEADEIIIPNKLRTNLGLKECIDLNLSGGKKKTIRCIGLTIDHDPKTEPPIDLSKPILDQRSKFRATRMFNKPLISNIPCKWHVGFHWLEKRENQPVDLDFILLHLHKMDYDLCKKKHNESSKRNWSKNDIEKAIGTHNRVGEGERFDKWFFSGCFFQKKNNDLKDLPEHIKNVRIVY